ERFKDLLLECPHHGLNTWHLCQIIYEGIDYQTKQLVESMCPDGFTSYTDENEAWNFLLDLGERTREWESAQVSERALPSKGYVIEGAVAKEAQLDNLVTRLESLIRGSTQVNQINQNTPMCSWCQSPNHVFEECQNYIDSQYTPENVSAMSQYNPYSNTYNPVMEEKEKEKKEQLMEIPKRSFDPPVPFPKRLEKNKKAPAMDKIIETFKQVQINIPLLEAIEQVPSYAKVLKDLCNRGSFRLRKRLSWQPTLVQCFRNPRCESIKILVAQKISCVIGNTKIDHALLGLGVSVNLLPSSVFEQLGLGELRPTNTNLQLADRSVKVPRGKIEDVLIKVGEFFFPVDFVVLDTQ
ncbi:LOW QUALITY PROTEIN: hypothetical protein CFOL_v3_10595, partial [Cephalotus follicularis]